jgi:hypothetical protein
MTDKERKALISALVEELKDTTDVAARYSIIQQIEILKSQLEG